MSAPPSFNSALQLAHGTQIIGDVGTRLLLVKLDKVVNESVVETITSEMCVTSSCKDFKDTIFNREEGDIKGITGMTTKVIHNHLEFAILLVQTINNGSGSRLVDNTKDLKTGSGTGVLGCLTLSIIEV